MFWGIIIEPFGLVSDRDTGLYSYNESKAPSSIKKTATTQTLYTCVTNVGYRHAHTHARTNKQTIN